MEGRRLFNPRALQVQPNPHPSAHKAGLRGVTDHPGAGVRGRGGRAAGGNRAGFGQDEHRGRSAAPIADEGEHVYYFLRNPERGRGEPLNGSGANWKTGPAAGAHPCTLVGKESSDPPLKKAGLRVKLPYLLTLAPTRAGKALLAPRRWEPGPALPQHGARRQHLSATRGPAALRSRRQGGGHSPGAGGRRRGGQPAGALGARPPLNTQIKGGVPVKELRRPRVSCP